MLLGAERGVIPLKKCRWEDDFNLCAKTIGAEVVIKIELHLHSPPLQHPQIQPRSGQTAAQSNGTSTASYLQADT